jgi:hypothetical protein
MEENKIIIRTAIAVSIWIIFLLPKIACTIMGEECEVFTNVGVIFLSAYTLIVYHWTEYEAEKLIKGYNIEIYRMQDEINRLNNELKWSKMNIDLENNYRNRYNRYNRNNE